MAQLKFRCNQCGLAGLTPDVTVDEAGALVRRQLGLRCPTCGAVITFQTTTGDLVGLAARAAAESAMPVSGAAREAVKRFLAEAKARQEQEGTAEEQ